MRCASSATTTTRSTQIVAYIDEHKTILGAPGFKVEHLPVFACSMGDNAIHYMGHVKMMAAVQPFISGAICKTVNMPEDVSVAGRRGPLHRVVEARPEGRRDLPRQLQGRPAARDAEEGGRATSVEREVERIVETIIVQEPVRQKLPRTRNSRTFSFRVADCHGYVTVGEYEDGRPGELFLKVAKQGSTLAGIMDAFAISVSHGLQYGVPLEAFVEMFTNLRFEPAGMTDDPDIRFATSLVDYIVPPPRGRVPATWRSARRWASSRWGSGSSRRCRASRSRRSRRRGRSTSRSRTVRLRQRSSDARTATPAAAAVTAKSCSVTSAAT